LSTREEICEAGAHLFRKYGPIVAEKFAGRYTVVHLFSPKDFHTVFQEEGQTPFRIGMAALKHYRDKMPKEYADASILHVQGEKWNRLRCATQEHLLRNQAASSYVSALNSVAEDAINVLGDLRDQRGGNTRLLLFYAPMGPRKLTPAVPGIIRKLSHDTVLSGYLIPAKVALGATACLQHLARHAGAQEKARSEVTTALPEDATAFQPDYVNRLPYLNACVKESMRLTPVVPGFIKKLNHDTVLSGYLVPAKTTIWLQTLVASQLDDHFSKPEEYRPERWLSNEENADDWVHVPSASLPFSAGKRSCLGRRIAELELCILLSKILQRYKIEHQYPDVGFHEKIFMIPKAPIRLSFKPLNKHTQT
ncbi:hypothetical protein MTO96_051865, partial [Rhipicephalus appendiculatus]